jgi:hypothetical protein
VFSKPICAALLLIAVAACASKQQSTDPAATTTPSTSVSREPDLITAQELASPSVSSLDALEAVRRLRPRFLAVRRVGTSSTGGQVQVSIDGSALETVNNLSRIRAVEIAEIRYLDALTAAQRFGIASGSGGVILVKRK